MELDDDIKNLFTSKFSSYQPEVPSSIWDKIEDRLEVGSLVTIPTKNPLQEKIIQMTLWASGVAALFIAAMLSLPREEEFNSIHAVSMNDHKLDLSLFETINKDSVGLNLVQSLSVKHCVTQSRFTADSNSFPQQKKGMREVVVFDDNSSFNDFIHAESDLPSTIPSEIELSDDKPDIESRESRQDFDKKIDEFVDAGKRQQDLLHNVAQKDDTEKLQLGIKGGGSLFSASSVKNDLSSMSPQLTDVSLRSVQSKMTHNQPINFGVSISKQLGRDLSIESGLTYTYLSSTEGADQSNKLTKRDEQYFHYLGIPLSLNYTLVKIRRFKIYSSLGAMIQMDFLGRRKSETYFGRVESQTYVKDKISQKNPQFSLFSGFGVSYPIYEKLRLYTNFGGAYYIDANNQYETIYSDKKWLVNLDIGIKFEF